MDKKTEKFIKSVLGVTNLDKVQAENKEEPGTSTNVGTISEDEIARQFQEDKETIKPVNHLDDYKNDSELYNRELSDNRENDNVVNSVELERKEWRDYVKEVTFKVNQNFLRFLLEKRRCE